LILLYYSSKFFRGTQPLVKKYIGNTYKHYDLRPHGEMPERNTAAVYTRFKRKAVAISREAYDRFEYICCGIVCCYAVKPNPDLVSIRRLGKIYRNKIAITWHDLISDHYPSSPPKKKKKKINCTYFRMRGSFFVNRDVR